jgi:general secretion pathway protein A
MINRVCEKTLMYAFQKQNRLIDDYMVKYVADHELING